MKKVYHDIANITIYYNIMNIGQGMELEREENNLPEELRALFNAGRVEIWVPSFTNDDLDELYNLIHVSTNDSNDDSDDVSVNDSNDSNDSDDDSDDSDDDYMVIVG